jgi:hypothetical protein
MSQPRSPFREKNIKSSIEERIGADQARDTAADSFRYGDGTIPDNVSLPKI